MTRKKEVTSDHLPEGHGGWRRISEDGHDTSFSHMRPNLGLWWPRLWKFSRWCSIAASDRDHCLFLRYAFNLFHVLLFTSPVLVPLPSRSMVIGSRHATLAVPFLVCSISVFLSLSLPLDKYWFASCRWGGMEARPKARLKVYFDCFFFQFFCSSI